MAIIQHHQFSIDTPDYLDVNDSLIDYDDEPAQWVGPRRVWTPVRDQPVELDEIEF